MAEFKNSKQVMMNLYRHVTQTTEFFFDMPALGFEADICIVRNVCYTGIQVNDIGVYHLWSSLTDDVICSFTGWNGGSTGFINIPNESPQTVLKLEKQPKGQIKFQLLMPSAVNIGQNGLMRPLIRAAIANPNDSYLCVTLDFLQYN